MSHTTENSDDEDLLARLHAHGQSFLSSFSVLPQSATQPKRKRRKLDHNTAEETHRENRETEIGDDEWSGFGSEASMSSEGEDSEVDNSEMSDEGADESADEVDDDEFRSDQPSKKQPQVVVFSAPSQSDRPKMSKLQAKSFMSSKVSKLREEVSDGRGVDGEADENEGDEERTNVQNDALLHKLVHTQLLSGSLNQELNLTPAQRRKALDGRVLELAAEAKLGKGESAVRQEERKKASKKVRMGLERKVDERRSKALEDAKNLGNYHHSIKHLFEADSGSQPDRRKRDRGLKLGVGRFSGGILKLSRDDIASVQGSGRSTRGSTRGGAKGSRRR